MSGILPRVVAGDTGQDVEAVSTGTFAGPVGASRDVASAIRAFALSVELCDQLATLADDCRFTPSCLIVTVFQETLRRYLGQSAATVGFYWDRSFVFESYLEGQPSIQNAVDENQRLLAGQANHLLPQTSPVSDGSVSFWDAGVPLEFSQRPVEHGSIHLALGPAAGGLSGCIVYQPKVWDVAVVDSLAGHFGHLLQSAIAHFDSHLGALDIVPPSEQRMLEEWNKATGSFAAHTVYDLFAKRAEETPDRAAVSFREQVYTYGEISARIDHLAERLRRLGVGPDVLVGVNMDRGPGMIIALLAIFKAGGGYLPLDPGLPPQRIAFMQEDAQPRVIITQSHLSGGLLPSAAATLCFDDAVQQTDADGGRAIDSSERDWPAVEQHHLAYVLYTSGSTGKPKGVQISHGAVTTMLRAMELMVPLGSKDVVLATTTIAFDISVFELFGPLTSGARVEIVSRSVATNGELLAGAINDSGATVIQATPSGWYLLLEAGWRGGQSQTLLAAGEPLDRRLANRMVEGGSILWNLYGPTEATVYATGKRIDYSDAKITVGRPLSNYAAWVLDAQKKLLPAGAIGELYLGGPAVGRGYLNRPELTAEKFITDPFDPAAQSKLYRTGDLARLLPDGELELLGRADDQVKIRGHRVELGEIETLFDSHPLILKCAAKVEDFGEDDKRIVAYIVPREKGPIAESDLRAHALQSLPSYVVPSVFVTLDSFPLTPSGKVDRKALSLTGFLMPQRSATADACVDELEQIVLDAWRTTLRVSDLTLDDEFFDVGGHSLLVPALFARIRAKTGQSLPASTLVEAQTPRKLAARLRASARASCLISLQPQGSRLPLYLIHHMYGDVLAYRPLAERFAPDRPVIGIQAPMELQENPSLASVEALAALYVKQILEAQPTGPFHLAGYSSGSVFAFEMARQLAALGHEVGLLGLIDGDVNGPGPDLPRLTRYQKIVVRKFYKTLFKFKDEMLEGPERFVMKRLNYLWLQWRLRSLERSEFGHARTDLPMHELLLRAERAYRPKPYAGAAVLLRFEDDASKYGPDPLLGWGTLIHGGLKVLDLPGSHGTAMAPQRVPSLAGALCQCLEVIHEANAFGVSG